MEINVIKIQAEYIGKLRVIDQRQYSAANSAAKTKASNKAFKQLREIGFTHEQANKAVADAQDMFMLSEYPGVVDALNNASH